MKQFSCLSFLSSGITACRTLYFSFFLPWLIELPLHVSHAVDTVNTSEDILNWGYHRAREHRKLERRDCQAARSRVKLPDLRRSPGRPSWWGQSHEWVQSCTFPWSLESLVVRMQGSQSWQGQSLGWQNLRGSSPCWNTFVSSFKWTQKP